MGSRVGKPIGYCITTRILFENLEIWRLTMP